MQFLMLALLGTLVGQGMRRVRMLRHVGQAHAARNLYNRYALLLGVTVLCAMGGWFFGHPWALALLAASVAGACFFVFWPERKNG